MPIAFPPRLPSYVQFVGGPIASLGTITGGSGYRDGTYPNVPLIGGTGSGALATLVIVGGVITAVTLTNIGAPLTAVGAIGYLVTDILTATDLRLGVGTGFAVPVASVGSYIWNAPSGLTMLLAEIASGGGGGGGGGTSGAGGGGGGSSATVQDYPVPIPSGAVLTITPGQPGAGGAVGAVGGNGTTTTITGTLTGWGSVVNGFGGNPGAAGIGGVGGSGGNPGQGPGGAAAAVGLSPAASLNPHYLGGAGGGGGGSAASVGGAGGGGGFAPFGGGASGPGSGSGGGGGRTVFGDGGRGGNGGASPGPGGSPPNGYGGGGGGGGLNSLGAPGAPGMVRFRF